MTQTRKEQVIRLLIMGTASCAVVILAGIFLMLCWNGMQMFRFVPVSSLGDAIWNPSAYDGASYGIGALFYGTAMVTIGAMLVAVPLGVGSAAYLSELAPSWVRELVKPLIEILAGIPSVVVGFIGIVLFSGWIRELTGVTNGLNALNGAILLAVMSVPTIISVSEDAIRSVPRSYREGAYALGASRWQTIIHVVIPAACPGIIAAILLGFGRALGETMTVLMATGNAVQFPTSFTAPVRTVTATIAMELGEVPYRTPHYYSLFFLGMVLFLISLSFNVVTELVLRRMKR